jgi:hypothetical protein
MKGKVHRGFPPQLEDIFVTSQKTFKVAESLSRRYNKVCFSLLIKEFVEVLFCGEVSVFL